MGKDRADKEEVRLLLELASDPKRATTSSTAFYHLLIHGLTVSDVCDALWHWIRDGKPVTRTVMQHGRDQGSFGYEIWPELAGERFYCKYVVQGEPKLSPKLFIVSAHPDRPENIGRGGQS